MLCGCCFFVLGSSALSQSASRQVPTPDAALSPIISRYEAWRGGDAFRNLHLLHSSGHLATSGLSGTIDVWSTPGGDVHQEVDLGAFKQKTIVNHGQGWSTALSGQVQKLSDAETADTSHEGERLFDGIWHGADGAALTARPSEEIQSHRVDVIRVSFPDATTYDYRFDPSDGSLLSIRSSVNGRVLTTSFDEWRLIDGVRVPFADHVSGDSPTDAATTEVVSVQVNPPLSKTLFAEPAGKSTGLFAANSESSGWLPFEFFNGTRIFIPATINGLDVKVMLDSGASSTVVDRAFAEKAGLKPEGAMTGEGTGGSAAVAMLNGVTLKLGTLTLTGQTMVATDLSAVQQRLGHPLPVILGNEIFQDAVVDIDFEHHRICFRNPALFHAPAEAHAVPAHMEDQIHIITASVEGRPASLEFDLGNNSPLLLYPRFWDKPEFLAGRPTSTTLTGGFGGSHTQQIAMVRSVVLGGSGFSAIPATFQDGQSASARAGRLDGNIGMPLLSRFHLIVDFPHNRVLFAPPVDTETPFLINRTGLTLQPVPAGVKVLYVAPQSPASKAGMEPEDVIVAVDGVHFVGETGTGGPQDRWRFGAPGDVHQLGLSDGRSVKLVLAQYF